MLIIEPEKISEDKFEWINIYVGDQLLRVTYKEEKRKKHGKRMVLVFDAPKEIIIIRDSLENKGNKS
jgi:hypothetical protein